VSCSRSFVLYFSLKLTPLSRLTQVAIDAIGLTLLAAAFALFLLPFTLAAYQPLGFAQPSMIAMLVLGIVGFFVFAAWEKCVQSPSPLSSSLWRSCGLDRC
jgi:hypothetical protein